MSCVITLVPIVVAMSATMTSSAIGVMTATACEGADELPVVETPFLSAELLLKTLNEHGLHAEQTDADTYAVQTESGRIRYFQTEENTPFLMEVTGVADLGELLDELDLLENEYRRNVQTYTYHKVMESMAEHGMSLREEEVMEDDSILLTLRV